jgi:hypothetical protein
MSILEEVRQQYGQPLDAALLRNIVDALSSHESIAKNFELVRQGAAPSVQVQTAHSRLAGLPQTSQRCASLVANLRVLSLEPAIARRRADSCSLAAGISAKNFQGFGTCR